MGLGSVRSVPLALARELAAQAREQLARGIDPIDARKAAALEQRAARAKLMTFRQCAEEYHAANLTRWRNQKHPQRVDQRAQAFRLSGPRPPVGRPDR